MTNNTVYLAGPHTHARSTTRNEWRDQITECAPFDVVNPTQEYSDEWPTERLVNRCFHDIEQSDGVLVGDTGHRSPGTWREVQYARERGMPVVVWDVGSPREDFVRLFPFAETCCGAVNTMSALLQKTDTNGY